MSRITASRRKFVISGSALLAASLAGCPGDDDDDDDVNDDDPESVAVNWVSAADNVDDEGDIEDMTGEDSVTIDNGDEGADGNYIFEPGIARIDSGTEVTWEWLTAGHDVTEIDGEGATVTGWEDHPDTAGEGTTHSETFDDTGVALYECAAHRAQNQRGALIIE